MDTFDFAVVGAGIYGLTIADHLVDLDQSVIIFDDGKALGKTNSSTGETRLFRRTILEDPAYSGYATYAEAYFRSLDINSRVYTETGLLLISEPGSRMQRHHSVRNLVERAAEVAALLHVPHELMSGKTANHRFPQINVDAFATAFYEPGALTLHVDSISDHLIKRLKAKGVTLRLATSIREVASNNGVTLFSGPNKESAVSARFAIMATGASNVTPVLPQAQIIQQPIQWFQGTATKAMPAIVVTAPHVPLIFGFPHIQDVTIGAKFVHENESVRPGEWRSPPNSEWEHKLMATIDRSAHRIVPGLGPVLKSDWRPYVTMPGSRIRSKWRDPWVLQVSGCSGHGYKLAPGVSAHLARALVAGRMEECVLD